MCGIAGFVGSGDAQDLARMSEALRHRGPDGQGQFDDPERGVHLAVRRLAILDPAHAAQPMCSPDGAVVVAYNGEIYNHGELRAELEDAGLPFSSAHSDTEVLLNAYRRWGISLTTHLDGMWALAIYDSRQRLLLLSRDRFGQKPLYYTRQGGAFVFASELTALGRHAAVRCSLSTLSVQKYFAYGFIPAPHSLYEDVHKLPAGCSLTVDVGTQDCELTRFWDFSLEPEERGRRADAARAEELRVLLGQAVKRQLQSDVPIGVFLSGGIDSSTICWFAAQERSESIDTFSVGFDRVGFDESSQACRAAAWLGSRHVTTTLSTSEARRVLPRIATMLDEPIGDSSLVSTFLLCESARPHVTVALGGEGADELFGGYDPFRILGLANLYARLTPRPVHRAIRLVAARLPSQSGYMSFDFRLNRLLRGLSYDAALWNPVWLGAIEPTELAECFDDPADVESIYSEAIELWDRAPQAGLIDKTMQFFVKLYFQDDILAKVDRAGMMNSVEVRSPFLDRDLVHFVQRLPARLKLRRGRNEYLLKEAMRPLLPPWIVDQAKHGFAVPMAEWLRDGWPIDEPARRPRGVTGAFIDRKISAHRAGAENNAIFLWSLWALAQTVNGRFTS